MTDGERRGAEGMQATIHGVSFFFFFQEKIQIEAAQKGSLRSET